MAGLRVFIAKYRMLSTAYCSALLIFVETQVLLRSKIIFSFNFNQMQVAVDISYYPLAEDYERPIKAFIRGLHEHRGLRIATNPLTTQVSGDYDVVMNAIQFEMKKSLINGPVASFVLKVLNVEIEPGKKVII